MRIAALFSLLISLFSLPTQAIEEPAFELIDKQGDYELRHYQPMIIAETTINGAMKAASNQGFRQIANYIFGNNTAAHGEAKKIAMTAPVTMSAASTSTQLGKAETLDDQQASWHMHFVMPQQYSLKELPRPNSDKVTLRLVPQTKIAVLRFSGLTGAEKVAQKTQDLLNWMNQQGLSAAGEAKLARYNPPWTLPFWRRNEILIHYQNSL